MTSPNGPADDAPDGGPAEVEPLVLPVDGVLDLHTFRPSELGGLIPDYLAECRASDILEVRIIHGKGTGALRRSVHAILERLPAVASYRTGDERSGSWGATLVTLRPPGED